MLFGFLHEEKTRQEEEIFLKALRDRKLLLAVSDNQEKILWWLRNKIGKHWYAIQGWQQYKIRPNFVAAKKTDDSKLELVYNIESRGEHLLGNADSQYKKSVLGLMTEQTRRVTLRVLSNRAT